MLLAKALSESACASFCLASRALQTPQATQKLASDEALIDQTSADQPSVLANANDSPLCDTLGRHHKYLRVSLTERCNLRCTYCMPAEGVKLSPKSRLLSVSEILRLCTLFADCGVTTIRLTGGEPTLRPDLVDIVENLSKLPTIKTIGLTTNGIALRSRLEQLAKAGLNRLNVSLDTLDPAKYIQLTRQNGLNKVLNVIEDASKIFEWVKINNVVIRNFNDNEVIDFVETTKNKNFDVRFIEYMPFQGNKFEQKKMMPYKELLQILDKKFPLIVKMKDDRNSTSKSYRAHDYRGKFGFISSMTENFCSTCDRLRITADGNLKVCLHGSSEISLRDSMRSGCTDAELRVQIGEAVKRKKKQHAGIEGLMKMTNRPMILIGG